MKTAKLGDMIQDKITGFQGVVTAHAKFQHNCDRVGVQSRELNDGKPVKMQWFDITQVDVIATEAMPVIPASPMTFNYGDTVKDTLSAYRGVVTGHTTWANGCIRLDIQSKELKDGIPVAEQYLPPTQVILVKAAKTQYKRVPTGGPMHNPTGHRDPR